MPATTISSPTIAAVHAERAQRRAPPARARHHLLSALIVGVGVAGAFWVEHPEAATSEARPSVSSSAASGPMSSGRAAGAASASNPSGSASAASGGPLPARRPPVAPAPAGLQDGPPENAVIPQITLPLKRGGTRPVSSRAEARRHGAGEVDDSAARCLATSPARRADCASQPAAASGPR